MIQEQTRSGVDYLEATLLAAQQEEVLELDEVWSFVGTKKNQVWIWLALCPRTRQIVAWWYGPRDALSCEMLWDKIPKSYQSALCYTDFYYAYNGIVPAPQHFACPKKQGQTNHIERFNLTLRQSVARLVRKTLSFSKKLRPHLYALRLFFVHYNHRMALRYIKQPNTST